MTTLQTKMQKSIIQQQTQQSKIIAKWSNTMTHGKKKKYRHSTRQFHGVAVGLSKRTTTTLQEREEKLKIRNEGGEEEEGRGRRREH